MLSPLQMDTGAPPALHASKPHPPHTNSILTSPNSAVMSPDAALHSASHGRRDSNGSAMQDTPTHSQHNLNLCSATESSSSSSSSSNANDDGSSVSSTSVSPPAVTQRGSSHAFSFGQADSAHRMEDVAGSHEKEQSPQQQQQQHQTQQHHRGSSHVPPPHSSQAHHPSPSHASPHHPQQSHRPSVPNSPNLGSQPAPSQHSPSHVAAPGSAASSTSGVTSAPSVAKRGQGFSCHHCKTHKMPELLLFCSNQSKKGPGKKRCRKKYCDSCLKRLYGHPADQPLQSAAAGFQCPACLGNCVCAGCERKATGGAAAPAAGAAAVSSAPNSTAATAGAGGDGASVGSNESDPSPHPIHSHSHSANSLNSARSSSPGPISLPPSNASSPGRPVHLQQQKPTTPQGKIAKKRRTSQDLGAAGSAMALTEDGSAMDQNGAASNTASSGGVFGGTVPASAVHPHIPAHTRALSGDQAMLTSTAFNPSSYGGGGGVGGGSNIPANPSRSRGNSGQPPHSLTTSPRLAVLTASGGSAGSRMIHLPPFTLASPSATNGSNGGSLLAHGSPLPVVGLGSANFASGAVAFATHIQQQVRQAVQTAAAAQQSAMDTGSALPELHSGSSATLSSHSPSLNSSAMSSSSGGNCAFSAPNSPFSTPRSNTRPLSAFSPVLGGAPESAHSEASGASAAEVSNGGSSIANLSMPSPNVSPNLFKRTLHLGGVGDSPAKPTSASTAAAPAVPPPSASPPGELELMKVLANVACGTTAPVAPVAAPVPAPTATTTNSASLPPAHPVRTDAASPKLSGYMSSVSLLSPPHGGGDSNGLLGGSGGLMQLQQLPPSAVSAGAPLGSSLGMIQAHLKAQHQMEVACLLQQQHQQLAELERLAIQEQHQQWQQQQQQQHMSARSSPLHLRMGMSPPVPIPVPLTKLESCAPSVVSSSISNHSSGVKLEPNSSGAAVPMNLANSQVIPPAVSAAADSDRADHAQSILALGLQGLQGHHK